eukprot:gene36104-42872_t
MLKYFALILLWLHATVCASTYVSRLGANANRAWKTPNDASEFPEALSKNLEKKKNFGIALSGGGMRAASNALGWLRAFNDDDPIRPINELKNAKYISVNSGASWVTLIALFATAAKMHSDSTFTDFSAAIRSPLVVTGPRDLASAQFLLRARQGLRQAMRKNNLEFALNA